MFSSNFNEIASFVNGSIDKNQDIQIQGIEIDSRKIEPQQLFVAIEGKNHDGHHYLKQAFEKGASAALVSRLSPLPIPQILVKDTIAALGALAAHWRKLFRLPVVAITGSSGKTTTKNMLGSILLHEVFQQPSKPDADSVLITEGNFNNHIGLPLTLLKLSEKTRYTVIEMGMNHFGELSYLTQLTQPDIAVITNAMEAHLEGVGNIAGVAKAKAEIFEGLSSDGIGIINDDDRFAKTWIEKLGQKKIITFGLDQEADIRASQIVLSSFQENSLNTHFQLHTPKDSISIHMPFMGQHNVYNALAASACAFALGISLQTIQKGLETASQEKRRFQVKTLAHECYLIDDTYNANPGSVKAALQSCATFKGKKIFVLGDMGELGENSLKMHLETFKFAKNCDFSEIYGIGNFSAPAAKELGGLGFEHSHKKDLIKKLKELIQPHTLILVKGSFFMGMDEIVKELTQ